MADSDHASLIDEFCKVTGTDSSKARMYLEASGWDNNLAMSSYFEAKADDEESSSMFERPESPKPNVPASADSNPRIATFSSLMNSHPMDDEEEGQAFYAGGSERSGQQVLGPAKRKAVPNEIVEEMFKAVRSIGAEVVDTSQKRLSTTKLKAFKGAGHVLGSTSQQSEVIAGAAADNAPQPIDIILRLWRTGFTINDGSIRDYNDSQNREFLDVIRKGEIPAELMHKVNGGEVLLNIEDHSHEDYVPKKAALKAFSGTGFRLGNITPPVVDASPESNQKNLEDAQKDLNVVESEPITSLQIRLADGSRLTVKANHSHTIGDIRRYIVQARPEYSASVFSLMTAYPSKELTDDSATLEQENLLNSVIVQKLK